MDPFIGSALIGAGSSAIGNILEGINSRRANHRAVENWKMVQAYNTPAMQMQRLKEAGLNPHLVYGNGADAQAVGSPAAPQKPNYIAPDLRVFTDVALKDAQVDNVQEQTNVNRQEVLRKTVQTANEVLKGRKSKIEAEIAEDMKLISMEAQKEQLRQMQIQTEIKTISRTVADQTKQALIDQTLQKAVLAIEQVKGQKLTNELRQLEIDLKEKGIENAPFYIRALLRAAEKNPYLKQFLD